jgi:hypothetical protein
MGGLLVVLVRQGAARRSARPPASALYGTGQPMGVESTDSFQSFYTFMDAYNVKLVDDDGKLLVDDPKVRDGPDRRAEGLHRPYIKGCTPPSSTTWKDPDNNVAFHNKHHRDDPQLHHLDRGEVARRRQQRGADRRAARRRQEGL